MKIPTRYLLMKTMGALLFTFMILSLNLKAQAIENKSSDCAIIFPTVMNVLYIGIDNPITIQIPGYKNDEISVMGCGTSLVNGDTFIARPTMAGNEQIIVTVETDTEIITYTNEFRVRRIPDPYIYCGNAKGSIIKLNEFQNTNEIVVKNPDFVFQIPYEIKSFEIVYVPKEGNRISAVTQNKIFTDEMNEIKKNARPGDILIINVVVGLPDGRNVPVTTSYKIIS